jgi:hypothetical protein
LKNKAEKIGFEKLLKAVENCSDETMNEVLEEYRQL